MNYNFLINKLHKNKYQNYLNLNKNFYKSYISSRSNLISKLNKTINKKKISNTNTLFKKDKKNKIYTFDTLNLIFEKFKKNKNIDNNDYKKIILFYHKFETNLILREAYNKKYKKITDIETNLNSYALLGFFIRKVKKINSLQKINCIIKINDHLTIGKFQPINCEIKEVFVQNIKYEIDYIIKINQL